MADKTHIEWTDATWNPLVGCTRVSPGCDNCYAEGVVTRWHKAGSPAFPNTFDVVTMRDNRMLTQPLRWATPRRIFVNSLSDLFHADVPDEFIAQVFAVMAAAQRHTFQLLTKRHARLRSLLMSLTFAGLVEHALCDMPDWAPRVPERDIDYAIGLVSGSYSHMMPLPNVWLGVSVEDQHWADIRIPALLETPSTVRWISAEPLLGPVRLGPLLARDEFDRGLDWVVVGGESGQGSRPMHPDWPRALRDECDEAGVAFLFKQWGNWAPRVIVDDADFLGGRRITASPDNPGGITVTAAGHGRYVALDDDTAAERVGKRAAGRELDGRTHDGYPQVVSA